MKKSRRACVARRFTVYDIYWVGRRFQGVPVTAADFRREYNPQLGLAVYYGGCKTKGLLGGGGHIDGGLEHRRCLPIQIGPLRFSFHRERRGSNCIVCLARRLQQTLHFPARLGVPIARLVEVGGPFRGRLDLQRTGEDGLCIRWIGAHGGLAPRFERG